MKKILLALLAVSLLFAACKAPAAKDAASKPPATEPTRSKADVSYAFGIAVGKSLAPTNIDIDYSSFLAGVKDVLAKKKTRISEDDVQGILQTAVLEAQAKAALANKTKGEEFLAANGKKKDVVTTASGLQYQVIKEGTGEKPRVSDSVKVHYVGTLLDGTTFDSSVDRGEPMVIGVGQVIPGWQEAVQLMKVGSKYRFWIPSDLAYGEQGAGDKIGPNSTIVFEVELLSIEPPAKN